MSGARRKTRKGDGTPVDRPKSTPSEEEIESNRGRSVVKKKRKFLNEQRERSAQGERISFIKPRRSLPTAPPTKLRNAGRDYFPKDRTKFGTSEEAYEARSKESSLVAMARREKSAKNEQVLNLNRTENSPAVGRNIHSPSGIPSLAIRRRKLPQPPVRDQTKTSPSVNIDRTSESTAARMTEASNIPYFVPEPKRETIPEQKDEVLPPPFLGIKTETKSTSLHITEVADVPSAENEPKTDLLGRIKRFFRRFSSTEKSLEEHMKEGETYYQKTYQNVSDFAEDIKKTVVSKARDYSDKLTIRPQVSVMPQSPESISSAATVDFIIPTRTRTPLFKTVTRRSIEKMRRDQEDKDAEVSKLTEVLDNKLQLGDSQACSSMTHSDDPIQEPAGATGGRDLCEPPQVGTPPRKRKLLVKQENVEADEPPRESLDDANKEISSTDSEVIFKKVRIPKRSPRENS